MAERPRLALVALVAGAALALPGRAPAQFFQQVRFSGALLGGSLKVRSALPTGAEALSGAVFSGEGRAEWQRFSLTAAYGQGKLDPDTAGPAARDYVDGSLFLGGRPVDWLELQVGPYARAYTSKSGVQRWLFWQLRARVDAPLVADRIRGYAEGWTALAANVSVAETFDGAFGGVAGVVGRVGRSPWSVRVQYAIDETRLGSGVRRETVEGLTLAVAMGGW